MIVDTHHTESGFGAFGAPELKRVTMRGFVIKCGAKGGSTSAMKASNWALLSEEMPNAFHTEPSP